MIISNDIFWSTYIAIYPLSRCKIVGAETFNLSDIVLIRFFSYANKSLILVSFTKWLTCRIERDLQDLVAVCWIIINVFYRL